VVKSHVHVAITALELLLAADSIYTLPYGQWDMVSNSDDPVAVSI
jgi:hypothetical protein